MNFQTLTYDMCRCYVLDCKDQGFVADEVCNRVLGWIRARDLRRLATCSDYFPDAYQQREVTIFARQVAAFFKKNAAFSDPNVCEESAAEAFNKAETICRITNKRLDHYGLNESRLKPELHSDICKAKRIIQNTLGSYTDFFENIPKFVRVTSGATATRPKRVAEKYRKVRIKAICSSHKAQPYLRALYRSFGYDKISFNTVNFNRVVTVPKNYKTNRTIACEPEGNLSLQLALNEYIKRSLLKIKVDLSSQFTNQELARRASISGDYSTIDLSMASDTLSFNTVAYLLPYEWFRFATDIRAPYGEGFGRSFEYAKFSSMGNGSTFTIETLVFASLVRAVTKKEYAVYGDDLIIETAALPRLLALLKFFGFSVNHDKSFTEGPFRESCGADWWKGENITPFYMRCTNSMKIELVHLVNGLATLSTPEGHIWHKLRDIISLHELPFAPFNQSTISGVWIDSHTAYTKGLVRVNKRQIHQFRAYCPTTKEMTIADSRTLGLWFLETFGRELPEDSRIHPWLSKSQDPIRSQPCTITSRVPIFSHKYKRKWVGWNCPAVATPVHIYLWTEFLFRIEIPDKNVGA